MTPDHQRAVSELLRSADKAIKEGNLDHALTAIGKVFEFDPRNVYARAYQERILSLKETQAASRHASQKPVPSPKTGANANPPTVETPVQTEPLPHAPAEHTAAPAPEPPESSPAPGVTTPPSQAESHPSEPTETPHTPSEQPTIQAQPPVTLEIPVTQPAPQPFEFVKHTPALLEAYKTLLTEIWANGLVTDVEQERILAMRETFAITDDEHASIEREVRIEAYLSAIEQVWKKGVTNFDALRRQYAISEQEHMQIEGRVFRQIQALRTVGTVLLIDDDPEFLTLAGREMTEAGYYCVAVTTCEEALQSLGTINPDIIVCDVNFAKPNMSGFAFYEKFRSMEKYFHVPFLFLSGMIQEAVQRTGMQMGADGYFLKPVDLELFLATIEGKIKRSREVQQRLAPHRP